jgi:acetyl esterase/lipase
MRYDGTAFSGKGRKVMMSRVFLIYLASIMSLSTAGMQEKSTYYTVKHADEFTIDWRAFYDKADEMTAAVRKQLIHHLDLPYGSHRKQRLDVYLPTSKSRPAPVLIFLHGGGFREGDRAHYGYVAKPFAAHGIVTVIASYRLTPEFTYPAQPDDAKQLLSWVYHNISSYGGDPGRVFISGHSAGAILAAFVGMDRRWLEEFRLPADLIKGCVPISGSYDLRSERRASYIPDPNRRPEASPILNISGSPPPCIVAVGSVETQLDTSKDFVESVREKGGDVQLMVLEGLEHDDIVIALGDEESELTDAILRLIIE